MKISQQEVLENLKKLKPRNSSEAKRLTPTKEEINKTICANKTNNKISAYQKKLRHYLILILCEVGLRIDECFNLKLKDVDLDNGTLFVSTAKGGKTRTIGLTLTAQNLLKEFIEIRRNM